MHQRRCRTGLILGIEFRHSPLRRKPWTKLVRLMPHCRRITLRKSGLWVRGFAWLEITQLVAQHQPGIIRLKSPNYPPFPAPFQIRVVQDDPLANGVKIEWGRWKRCAILTGKASIDAAASAAKTMQTFESAPQQMCLNVDDGGGQTVKCWNTKFRLNCDNYSKSFISVSNLIFKMLYR